jgi:poly(glycerol-phosphate) alpha-glucosyltransferase
MNTTSVLAAVSRKAGGLQNSVRRLHQCLNELPGVSVRIVSLLDEHSTEDIPEWLPLPVKACPVIGPRAFGYSPQMLSELLSDDAPIMHTHGIWQYPSVAMNAWHQKTGKPYLISPHGMLDSWAVQNSAWKKRIALALYERKHLEKAACIRALCESEAQSIRAFGLKNPIAIIPNGIDLPPDGGRRTEDGRQSSALCPLPSDRKVLLYLGRLHPKKGLANLLRAWAAVQGSCHASPVTRHPDWVLAIAGWDQGGHEAELKSLATELNIPWTDVRDRRESDSISAFRFQDFSVLFLGPVFGQEKAACYANCDAFILPSFSEGLPMVILEAWAYGKPVLMTPECNLPEGFTAHAALRIEQVGRVTPCAPGVGHSIERGLADLFRLPSSGLCSLGSNGRNLVAEKFTWPKIATNLKSVYDWVLGGGEKPGCVQ